MAKFHYCDMVRDLVYDEVYDQVLSRKKSETSEPSE